MLRSIQHLIMRPLIGAWLNTSMHSWQRRVTAQDSPHVHARGTDPDRVLLTGDGAASGRGVLTHELGLPGFLARSLSESTGRAADVDVVVAGDMTALSCLEAIKEIDLVRFDAVVLTLGGNEALALTGLRAWRTALASVLDDLEHRAPAATSIFLLSIPLFSINPHFPAGLARVVDRHVHDMNAVMQELADARTKVDVIFLTHADRFEKEGPRLYEQWGEKISTQIGSALDPARSPADRAARSDEAARQQALDDLDLRASETDPVLESLTESARKALGTPIAAITLIDGDTQVMRVIRGIDRISVPRTQSFCDITIRHASALVIEDARSDPRYADYPTVTGDPNIRFYAGYPIESPDGHRIGALCVLDTEPRVIAPLDVELLRTLALYVQEHLWQGAETSRSESAASER